MPTDADMRMDDGGTADEVTVLHRKRVPVGTSGYQAAWIADEDSWSDASEELDVGPMADLAPDMDFSDDADADRHSSQDVDVMAESHGPDGMAELDQMLAQ